MTWVWINGHRYYRRSRRVNGRVVTEHVGRGRIAELETKLDADLRKLRRATVASERLDFEALVSGMQDVLAIDRVLADVFAVLAHRSGWHRHNRQWRRKRGFDMGALRGTIKQLEELTRRLSQPKAVPPLVAPDLSSVPEADRATLSAAAKGDKAALEQARPYLEQKRYQNRWGNPAYAARCWLVGQASGEDKLTATATHTKADALADDLGFQSVGPLEQLAIYRVVNCWLAVGVLEAKSCQWGPHTRERLTIERCLALADRRLTAAVKLLATVRRVPVEELLGRVHTVTTYGPPALTTAKGSNQPGSDDTSTITGAGS